MGIILWWVFIIIIIAIGVNASKKEQEKVNQEYAKKYPASPNRPVQNTNSSYYTKQKVEQYRRMEQDHKGHVDDIDLTSDIGYKRCPKCEALVSKKSDTCFMCEYSFEKEDS